MIALRRLPIHALACAACLSATSLAAGEIVGRVSSVDERTITIAVSPGSAPVVGERVESFIEVSGVGRAVVGKGRVTAVNGDSVTAVIDEATGTLAVGQQAAIYPSVGGAAPPNVGTAPNVGPSAAPSSAVDPRDTRFKPSPKVQRGQGWLGLSVNSGDYDERIEVQGVLRDGPAARADLQSGDIILSMDGKPYKYDSAFTQDEAKFAAGETVEIVFDRDGRQQTAQVTFDPIPADGGAGRMLTAAEAGEAWAMNETAWRYHGFDGFHGWYLAPEHHDKSKFYQWQRRAHEAGFPMATALLAGAYAEGSKELNVEKDLTKVMPTYERALAEAKALRLRSTEVTLLLYQARMLLLVPELRDEQRALAIYRELAERGIDRPLVDLADRYRDGKDVAQSTEQALRWYYEAAKLGNMNAQYQIGKMAYDGTGVEQDFAVARNWFKLAADQESGRAAKQLAEMCEQGQGGPRDFALAIRGWEIAGRNCLVTEIGKNYARAGRLYEQHAAELGLSDDEARQRAVACYRHAGSFDADCNAALARLGATLEPQTGHIEGWGERFNPDGDCVVFLRENGPLIISVPGTVHDLWPGRPDPRQSFNAPRVWRDVEGDFVAQVRVFADWKPYQPDTNNGAGLVVWDSEANFLRWERHVFMRDGRPTCSTAPMCIANHKKTSTAVLNDPNEFYPCRSTWLRIERKGSNITSALSHNGRDWIDTGTLTTTFPSRLKVGVFAFNASSKRFQAEFAKFSVSQ